MPNYDYSLDMETDNSNSLILKNIKPNSIVLEFGTAYGRMTKYLKEQLNCQIDVVEQDQIAGSQALMYANTGWIGNDAGDIEKTFWFEGTSDKKYDYIVFADVLEHLRDPQKALQLATKRLACNGSILISIPNVAHNAVLIDLLQDKFEYRDYGILDRTHIKFFTYNSLRDFVARCGLTVSKEMNAVNVVDNTEFKNTYSQVPSEIGQYLQKRKYGEVYQFIWELKKNNVEVSIVVPIFNKWNFSKGCLEDLLRLDAAKTEIIIVDNASTDETFEQMKHYQQRYSNVQYIRNNENLGFGKACGIGYNKAQGNHVMFLNNDIRVKDKFTDWTDLLINKCNDNNLVGPTGGKVDPNNDFQFLYETADPTKDINYLSGWCIIAKKNVWEKLDISGTGEVFSSEFFCYFEDTDLSFRAREMGISLDLASVPVVHFGKVSSKQLNTYGLYTASRNTFVKKWKHLFNK